MHESSTTTSLLRSTERLRRRAASSAIDALRLPRGGHGLDAGCGIGSHIPLLLEATAPGGVVTGLDLSGEHIAAAVEALGRSGASDRVVIRQGDAGDLPFEDDSFDWAWSVDCIGFIPGDPIEMVRGLARVVKPGGTVALLLWSSQQLLPGYPFLEARLNGTATGAAPAIPDWPPHRHPLRALGWLSGAGLEEMKARTFVVDFHGPLEENEKEALAAIIEMRWGNPESELSNADWELFNRATNRGSPDSVVDSQDYFGFFTYSLFWGCVPPLPAGGGEEGGASQAESRWST